MIGNEVDAEFIRDYVTDVSGDYYRDGTKPPKGWKRLGSGCYRSAWLHEASGVVYKVQHGYLNSWQSNEGEAGTLRRYFLKKMPKGCRLPRWQYFALDGRGVIAMERFTKLLRQVSRYQDPRGYHDRLRALRGVLNDVSDFHGGNLAIDEENDLLVPIDLGG